MKAVCDTILATLDGSSREKKIHWSDIVKATVGANKCTFDELVSAMNNVLMPFGEVSGADHNYWLGKP